MAIQKLGELFYDTNLEEGVVKILWNQMPDSVIRLDILGDWAFELSEIYKKEKIFPEKIT